MSAAVAEALPVYKGKPGWEFTPIDKLDLDAFPAVAGSDAAAITSLPFAFDDALTAGGADRGDGVLVAPLRAALDEGANGTDAYGSIVRPGFFAELNAEQWTDGTLVYIPAGVVVTEPIVITNVQGDAGHALHHRTLIVLADGAEAEVYEQLVSGHDEQGLVNGVTELIVGQNARLRYYAAQDVNDKTWVFGSQRATIARDGHLDWTTLGFGGTNGKVFLETTLDGPGADAKVTGAYATRGRQHLDYDTLQEHAAANTTSDLAFRGLVGDRSTAVWRGMIRVDEGAQGTDAFQEARNLLLGKKAHADAIPGLEILADDVRCTHAAAISQIDAEQIFYLQSRGLDEVSAARIIVEGFLAAITERYTDGRAREAIAAAIDQRLAAVLG